MVQSIVCFITAFLLLFSPPSGIAQSKKIAAQSVDEHARSLAGFRSENLDSLSKLLTKNFSSDSEKVRSVFVWVAENIAYDVALYTDRVKFANVLQHHKDQSQSVAEVFKHRKAVCEGYANLVKALCMHSGIRCKTVEGIGRPKKNAAELHGWNAVWINGNWNLLDVTWAAGAIDTRTKKFQKSFDDTYFLMPPEEFIKTHYPFDPMWQLIFNPVSKKEFDEGKYAADKKSAFHYADTIAHHFALDSILQLIHQHRRIIDFDSGNHLAEQNYKSLVNYRENQKMNHANDLASRAVDDYNECVRIANEAKQKRNSKILIENKEKLMLLINQCKSAIEKAMMIYEEIVFTDRSNEQILKMNYENCKNNLKQVKEFEKYLEKYFGASEKSK